MSLNYFADFSSFLKKSRENAGIGLADVSARTRIPFAYLDSIERGEFDFASSVLIQGYLRQYARITGLNEDAVARQYNLILKKIDYVSSDHHLPPPFIEQPHEPVAEQIRDSLRRSKKWIRRHNPVGRQAPADITEETVIPGLSPGRAGDSLSETDKKIDEEVARKWQAERRLTNRITAFCICLLALSFVFFLSEPTGSGSQKYITEENTTQKTKQDVSQESKRLTATKKIMWDLTPALLTEEEILEKERVRKWLDNDSLQIRDNLVSQSAPRNRTLRRISVHESVLYQEKNY